VSRGRQLLGTTIAMELFDLELYYLICERAEERWLFGLDGTLEPYDLSNYRGWWIKVN